MERLNRICVKCGFIIVNANNNQLYCPNCAHKVQLQHQAEWRKKAKQKLDVIQCEYCGNPMRVTHPGQKMHVKCEQAIWKQDHKKKKDSEFKLPQKSGFLPPKYTTVQCDRKAKEYGISYGKYVLLLSQGKVDPPDER